jgi:multiple antibiotic resistance protein
MSLLSIAFSLFLLMNSIGNIPLYLSVLKGIDVKRQRYVITREMLIALFIIILFYFIGNGLMRFLNVTHDTIQIAGGVILFLLCMKMIFPSPQEPKEHVASDTEPLVVPLAIPLIAGPAVLAAVMIYSRQNISSLVIIGAIFFAWMASLLILLASPYLKNRLGGRGLIAMERLMGLIMILIAIQMFLSGISSFVHKQHLEAVEYYHLKK